jgi:hypothetical protein
MARRSTIRSVSDLGWQDTANSIIQVHNRKTGKVAGYRITTNAIQGTQECPVAGQKNRHSAQGKMAGKFNQIVDQ